MATESKSSVLKTVLTGRWRVNKDLYRNQKELMNALGRSKFEQWAIKFADEDLFLLHFSGMTKNKIQIHKFYKNVHIHLKDPTARKFAKTMYKLVKKDPDVTYAFQWTPTLSATKRKVYQHEDDQKKFGQCESECFMGTTYDEESKGVSFTVNWRLTEKGGILKNSHFINDKGQLVCRLDFVSPNKTVSAIKVYDRIDLTPEDYAVMNNHKQKKQLVYASHDPKFEIS